MNKKIVTLAFLTLFVTLIALPACNAVITPVEVEKVKDFCYVRVKGDHNSESFLFHYVNLSPQTQIVRLVGAYTTPEGITIFWAPTFWVLPGDSIDVAESAGYGYSLDFTVSAKPYDLTTPWTLLLEESVIIPPKQ